MTYFLVVWLYAHAAMSAVPVAYSTLAACEQAGAAWEQGVQRDGGLERITHHVCVPHQ